MPLRCRSGARQASLQFLRRATRTPGADRCPKRSRPHRRLCDDRGTAAATAPRETMNVLENREVVRTRSPPMKVASSILTTVISAGRPRIRWCNRSMRVPELAVPLVAGKLNSGQGIPISELSSASIRHLILLCRRVQRTTEVLIGRISQADHNALNVLRENMQGAVLVDALHVGGGSISVSRLSQVPANTSIAWSGAGHGTRGSTRTWERSAAALPH